MQVLLTAFQNTSSDTLIKCINGYDRLILENDKTKSVQRLEQALKNKNYQYIISFGQRPLIKDKIYIECQAVISGEVIGTSFNINTLKKHFEYCGTSVKLSNNAGTSYCNNIYFHGMKMLLDKCLDTKMVFIHIPYMNNISRSVVFFKSIEHGINKFLSEAV